MRDSPLFDETYRVSKGPLSSSKSDGTVGAFLVPTDSISILNKNNLLNQKGHLLQIISHDGHETGWEHVSVTVNHKPTDTTHTPTWEQMAVVKQAFFCKDEPAFQYHPKEEKYVDLHKDVLHLFSPVDGEIRTPPSKLV